MTTPTDEDRARLRAHLDRAPWLPHDDARCSRCDHFQCNHITDRDLSAGRCLHSPCLCSRYLAPWRTWFDGGEYLGEVSARTGPDAVETKQRCGCEVCKDGRDG